LLQIQNNMKTTTNEIGKNIDSQNTQIRRLMPLRTIVDSISNAKTEEDYTIITTKLKMIQNSKTDRNHKQEMVILKTIDKLVMHKEQQINALKELTILRKFNLKSLSKVEKQAISIVDNAEFDSALKIDDAIAVIKDKTASM
jgi:hypothetical protein